MKKNSVLLIYTGGTIGMQEDPVDHALKPYDFSHIKAAMPELERFSVDIDTYTFSPLIDSSNVDPGVWQKIAELIAANYDAYDGFVVLHGTDTMAYSASALSFMLEGLDKPVIFTGSQLPIGVARTDGRENLISSIEIAATKDADGRPMVPEVCICFDSKLLRGNRSVKTNADRFDAFRSPNFPELAHAGITLRFNNEIIHHTSQKSLKLHTSLDTRVAILKVHPGITEHITRHMLCDPHIRAVILETYGSGNSLSTEWFIDIVRDSCRSGKIILNVTQCLTGNVEMERYQTGLALAEAGVISGSDMTTEAALAKLFVLMGRSADNEEVKKLLVRNVRGELTSTP